MLWVMGGWSGEGWLVVEIVVVEVLDWGVGWIDVLGSMFVIWEECFIFWWGGV
jgi:hypothetical protein